MFRNQRAKSGVRSPVAGDTISRLNLQAEFFSDRIQAIRLLVAHVREIFSLLGKFTYSFLRLVLLFDFATNGFIRTHGRRTNIRHLDDVETVFRFNWTHDLVFLRREDSVFKRSHHHATTKEVQIPAFLSGTWVLRVFLGVLSKVIGICLHLG